MAETLSKELAVLLFTDIVGSVALQKRLGTEGYTRVVARHDTLIRKAFDLAHEPPIILKETGDGVLVKFKAASLAVEAALRIQYLFAHEDWPDDERVQVRVGIHSGEVTEMAEEITGDKRAVGMAINLAARVMDLAEAGQILMTRAVFDDSRQFLSRHPSLGSGEEDPPPLQWPAHGRYLFKGYDEPLDIFEVGTEKVAPLSPPEGGDKAKRAVAADEEATLGWRPGAGLDIPRREDWCIVKKIGTGGFGEVWLAENGTTKEQRVFKFCFDPERLRSFKRELTLFRLLRDALGKRKDIAALYDVSVDEPPFYLESEYVPTGNLALWAESKGGIAEVPLSQRIKLLADAARATGAAHTVGVIHKDLKPSNILVAEEEGEPQPRLADFGIGTLASNSQLHDLGITEVGFTRSIEVESNSRTSGTPLYTAPEYVVGAPPSVQGDIYALGVMLYQLVAGDLSKPLGSGWQRNIEDELLREDIARCVDLEPSRRFESALEVADRLDRLEERRAERKAEERQTIQAARRRRWVLVGGMTIVALGVVIGLLGYAFVQQQRLEKQARVTASNLDFRIAGQLMESGRSAEAVAHLARAVRLNPENLSAGRKLMALLAHRNFLHPQHGPHSVGGPGSRHLEVKLSPDESRIAVAHDNSTKISVWEVESGKPVVEGLDPGGMAWEFHFLSDGKYLVVNTTSRVRVFEVETGEMVRDVSAPGLLSGDGSRWFRVHTPEHIEIEDVLTEEVLHSNLPPITKGAVRHLEFEPTGKWIVGLFIEQEQNQTYRIIRVLDLEKEEDAPYEWEEVGRLTGSYDDAPRMLFASSSAKLVAMPDLDGVVNVWSVPERELLQTFYKPGDQCLTVAFSEDDEKTIVGYFGKVARTWDLKTGRAIGAPLKHDGGIAFVAVSPDGSRVVTGSLDNTARVWDLMTGNPLTEPLRHTGASARAFFINGGRRLVTISYDGYSWIWDLTGREASPESLFGGERRVLAVSRDAKRFAIEEEASGGFMVYVVDADGKRLGTASSNHRRAPEVARFSRDGSMLVSFSRGGNLSRIHLDDDRAEEFKLGAGGAAFHDMDPDGKVLLTSGAWGPEKNMYLWREGDAFKESQKLEHPFFTRGGAVSAGGERVFVRTHLSAWLWERGEDGNYSRRQAREMNMALSQQFSDDGKTLLIGRVDDTAEIWDFDEGKRISGNLAHIGPVVAAQAQQIGEMSYAATATAAVGKQGHSAGVYLWDLGMEEPVSPPLKLTGSSTELFSSSTWVNLTLDPKGTRLYAVTHNRSLYWDISPSFGEEVPDWVAALGESMVGMKLDEKGKPRALLPADRQKLREEVLAEINSSEEESLQTWGRWLTGVGAERTISPTSTMSMQARVRQLFRRGDADSLRQALHTLPGEPAVMAALSAHLLEASEDVGYASWLADQAAEFVEKTSVNELTGLRKELWGDGLVALVRAYAVIGKRSADPVDERAGYLKALDFANRALDFGEEESLAALDIPLSNVFLTLAQIAHKEERSEEAEALWMSTILATGRGAGLSKKRAFTALQKQAMDRGEVPPPFMELCALGSDWNVEDSGTDLGTGWRAPDFDDSGWAQASAPLGFGDAGLTAIKAGPEESRTPTIYFRRPFDVQDPGAIGNLRVKLRRDDGAVVYLNGREILRSNLPAGIIQYTTWASSSAGGSHEDKLFEFFLGAETIKLLKVGVNHLAVEIHQSDATSSDLGFDLELTGNVPHSNRYLATLDREHGRDLLERLDFVPREVARLLRVRLAEYGGE